MINHSNKEKELLLRIAEGDEKAFTELFNAFDPKVYPFVLKMVKSESLAEEITQEVFVKIWTGRSKLTHIENPEAYIIRMAANHSINAIKKHVSDRVFLLRLSQEPGNDNHYHTENQFNYTETRRLIDEAAELLPAQQKQVFHLSRTEGLNYEEIAERMKISKNTVRNHLVEALKSIRRFLQEHGVELSFFFAVLSQLQ